MQIIKSMCICLLKPITEIKCVRGAGGRRARESGSTFVGPGAVSLISPLSLINK